MDSVLHFHRHDLKTKARVCVILKVKPLCLSVMFKGLNRISKKQNCLQDGLGKGLMGVSDHDLANIPRNFSLTDLGLDTDHGGLSRNISFPDFPALDLDSGGEHN